MKKKVFKYALYFLGLLLLTFCYGCGLKYVWIPFVLWQPVFGGFLFALTWILPFLLAFGVLGGEFRNNNF